MKFFEKIKDSLIGAQGSEIITRVVAVFALLYHVAALEFFYLMKVYPMFYFNCASVLLFLIVTVMIFSKFIKDITISYFICYFEVLLHQLLADYFLGISSAFHYFILLMGFLGFLIIKKKKVVAVVVGIVSTLIFIILEAMSAVYTGPYEDLIAEKYLLGLRHVNIFLGVSVLLMIVLIYSSKASSSEKKLEAQINKKSKEVLYQNTKINRLQNHIINSLAALVENRDTDTGEHIQRTSAYVEIIARKAFENHIYPDVINEQFISLVTRAAPMHDIGKIVVPDEILKKPGRLTPEEFEQMKRHTTEGGRIIEEIVGISEDKKYLQTAIDVSKAHHERWDGKGYPNNLKGDEIPVSSRIMAIADVFDALVSPRCYKDPISVDEAVKIIREEEGSHFDPILVEVFLSEPEQIRQVLRTYTK